MTRTFALALGGGGARGIAHVAVLEVLDELGLRPAAIAGSSVGAMIGAAYAAGMSGRDIRRHIIRLAHNRTEVLRRLLAARAGNFASLFSGGFGSATQIDGEKFCEHFLPATVPQEFAALRIPLLVIASDLYRREQVVLASGSLRQAVAASIALPTLVRPVVIGERVLIDGGATNPLPFDPLRGRADAIVAVDISGEPNETRRDIPTPWEAILATVLVMGQAITSEKLKHGAPDLIIRPKVGLFRTLDFFQASAILRVCEGGKAEIRDKLKALLESAPSLQHDSAVRRAN
ncbi:MAG: patatin-like phospholipase family protein [Hyphomicrobiales bacterium]|nr:patatin-like phospholipase family protein [Hyphomicrobiales bacterium]